MFDGYEYSFDRFNPVCEDQIGIIVDDDTIQLNYVLVKWDEDSFTLKNGEDAAFMELQENVEHDFDHGAGTYKRTVPNNPNNEDVVGDAVVGDVEDAVNSFADDLVNSALSLFIDSANDDVDKSNIGMFYGTWYDNTTGKSIVISTGKNGNDYLIDLSSEGYKEYINGIFTASQSIYMRDIDMGIIMNQDGSISLDLVSLSAKNYDGGRYVRK